jgi:hypothetical protein
VVAVSGVTIRRTHQPCPQSQQCHLIIYLRSVLSQYTLPTSFATILDNTLLSTSISHSFVTRPKKILTLPLPTRKLPAKMRRDSCCSSTTSESAFPYNCGYQVIDDHFVNSRKLQSRLNRMFPQYNCSAQVSLHKQLQPIQRC